MKGKDDFLIVLGSSSGLPQSNRACSGYLMKVGSSCSLIDCGGGVTSSFLRTEINPLSVDRIFISHTHPDHVCEIPLFLQLVYLKGRTKRFDIYVPSEFEKLLAQYLYAVYLIKERLPFELKIIGYENNFEFHGNFTLEAYENKHLAKYSDQIMSLNLPNKMMSHSFELNINGEKILYSGDIADIEDIRNLLDGCKYAIIESTHINLPEFLKIASGFKVGKYIFTHLGSLEEVAVMKKSILESGIKNIWIAEDGMLLPI